MDMWLVVVPVWLDAVEGGVVEGGGLRLATQDVVIGDLHTQGAHIHRGQTPHQTGKYSMYV